MGFIYAKGQMDVRIPSSISSKICLDWMIVGQACTKPYGMCPKKNGMFGMLSNRDKDVLTDFVVTTEGVWFNQKCFKTLEASKAWKLGDENGHETPYNLLHFRHDSHDICKLIICIYCL